MDWRQIEKKAKAGQLSLCSVKCENKKGYYRATYAVDIYGNTRRITKKSFMGGIEYLLAIGAKDKRTV